MFIRVIAVPPGEAPEEVRRAWVGLELPLVAGETGPRAMATAGVLSGPRTLLATLLARLTVGTQRHYGYVLDAPQALALLAEQAPGAAQWWRERAPHCWQPGRLFVFPAAVCAEVAGGPVLRWREPAPAPSQQIVAAPPPTPPPQGIAECPTPGVRLGLGVPFRGPPESRRLRLAVQECVGWIACGSAVFFALGDVIARCYGLIGVRIFFLVVGAVVVWRTRAARRLDEQEAEPPPWLSGEAAPERPAADRDEAFHMPEGTAKTVELKPTAPTFTFESRAGACVVEPTLAERRLSWGHCQLVQRAPDRLEVVPHPVTWLFGLLIGIGGPAGLWVWMVLTTAGCRFQADPDAWSAYVMLPLLQLTAVVLATQGVALLTGMARIDRGAGEVRLRWFFRQLAAHRLAGVIAVQAAAPVGGRHRLCQVNLVFDDPKRQRLCLIGQGFADQRGQDVLWFGRRLAVFLGKPLVDQVEAMAVLEPTQVAGLFTPDWLAGSHNARLIDHKDGVLDLRPVPRQGGALMDGWAGVLFRRACASVRFDKNRGRPPRLFVRLLAGDGLPRLPDGLRKPRSLHDVEAVELAPDQEVRPDFGTAAPRPTCRLRLRLRDANQPILELAPHADEAWARETGGQIARFIGAPLEDRIRPAGA